MLVTGAFSEQIRNESLADHKAAEDSRFIAALMDGQLSREQYAAYLAQFQAVYASLDTASESLKRDLDLHGFYDPHLSRSAAIAQDLQALNCDGVEATAATARYVARINELAGTSNLGVLAHHYTRYLGDLSGGRIIAQRLARHLQLTPAEGLAFYQFPEITKPPKYKQEYRDRLDSLQLTADQREQFVEEVRLAYRLNSAVFTSLESLL